MTIGSIEGALGSRRARRAWIYGLGLATGLLAGLVAVAYRALAAALESLRASSFSIGSGAVWPRILSWLGACALAGAAVSLMVRKAPLIKGSGIPQVKAELARRLRSDWRRELPFKFAGGSLALGAGLSLGREGPSIQLGSLAGAALAELSGRPETRRYLLTAGAAAGIAAAFNAPLAGVLFCLEELHRNFSPVMLGCSMLAALAADGVSRFLLGDGSVFGFSLAATLPLRLYPLVLALGAACGLLGAGFNAALLGTQSALRRLVPREGARILAVFVAGGLVALLAPRIAGGGHALVEAVAGGGFALPALAALALGKLLFTLASYGSGSPGGIFLPMLALGALVGGLASGLGSSFGLPAAFLPNFILLGMVGFFTAVVRAPITGAILVTEMAGSFGHFPAFILAAVAASLVASLLGSEPIYDSLLALLAPAGYAPVERGEAVVLHVPVLEGSVLDLCEDAQAAMPEGCVLVGVVSGEEERIARPEMEIRPGDLVEVLVAAQDAGEAKEKLRLLAGHAPHSVEHPD